MARRIGKGLADRTSLDALSTREIQVLRGLALGRSNREIAESYAISTKTVDTYRFRLLKKLGLRNNAELTRFAIQNRIVEP
jgi:DNA-binding NarL/FixJ family response regulator